MGRIWAVAANGFREVLDRRLAWIAVLLGLLGALLVGLKLWPGSDSHSRRASAWSVYFILDAAGSAAGLLGLVVGSGVLASEMRARTIVTLLARPVERWEFVLGRWLGAQLFAALLIAEGSPPRSSSPGSARSSCRRRSGWGSSTWR